MQYALIDGHRVEARPGLHGQCLVCSSPVIARCGEIRVHHWAHRGERRCDPWWEPETPWHRRWKGRFDPTWREFPQLAPDGEKHIADVRSPSGRVIEFQHSFLNPNERRAREAFYRDMIWVVDGMRRKNDRKRFAEGISRWAMLGKHNRIFVTPRPDEGLPREWLNSTVPVFFDFGDEVFPDPRRTEQRPAMWCLLPGRALGYAVIVEINKGGFINRVRDDNPILDGTSLMQKVERQLIRTHAAMIARRHRYVPPQPRPRWQQRWQRRRRTPRF